MITDISEEHYDVSEDVSTEDGPPARNYQRNRIITVMYNLYALHLQLF